MREASRIAWLSGALTLGLLMSSCSDPSTEADTDPGEPGALKGILRSATADYFDQNRSEKLYALQLKDGRLVSLQFSGRPEVRPGSEILVWGKEEVDGLHVERVRVNDAATDGIGRQGSAVIDPTPLSPPIKAAFVSVSAAYTNDMLQARILRDDFIRQTMEMSSYGRWTMQFDVYGPYTIANDCGGSFYSNIGTNGVAAMKAAGVDTSQYQQIQFLLGSTFTSCSWGGFGLDGHTPYRTNGVRGEYNPWSYVKNDGQGVMVQEIGHNWGLAHVHFCPNTQTPTASCTGYSEYGSPFTPMSNGNQVYLNSWERIQMNFFEGCNVVTVDTSGTFEIGSINLSCNGPQVLRIKADRGKTSDAGVDFQRYYYLEYRTPVGIDKTNGVLLHYAPDLKEGGWSRCDWGGPDCPEDFIVNPISATAKEGLLTEGAAWTTPQNVGIKIVSVGETAKFEFTFPTQGDAPTCLEGKPWDNQAPVCKVPSVSDGGTQPPPGDAAPPRTDAGSGDAAPPPPDDAGATGGSGGTGGSTGGTGGATAGTGGSGGDDKGCSCRVPGSGTSNRFSAFTALAGLALAAGARRRSRRRDRS